MRAAFLHYVPYVPAPCQGSPLPCPTHQPQGCPSLQINKVFGGDVPVLPVGQEELTAVCKHMTDIDAKVRS